VLGKNTVGAGNTTECCLTFVMQSGHRRNPGSGEIGTKRCTSGGPPRGGYLSGIVQANRKKCWGSEPGDNAKRHRANESFLRRHGGGGKGPSKIRLEELGKMSTVPKSRRIGDKGPVTFEWTLESDRVRMCSGTRRGRTYWL